MVRLIFCSLMMFAIVLGAYAADGARVRKSGGPVIKGIEVVGADHFGAKKIKTIMRTKVSKFLRKKRLREATLEADMVSIAAFYRRNGFLDATAVNQLEYDEDKESVWIKVTVTEGEQTTVERIEFTGNESVAAKTLLGLVRLQPGKPLDETALGEDKYNVYTYYADRGYVFAVVSHEISGTNGEATVTYHIDEGKPAGIRRIDLQGNQRVRDGIIRREVSLKPGDTFSHKKVLNSQQRLYDTGLFKDVEIEPTPGEADSATVDLVVNVKERKMREASFGVGYGTREEARTTVGWLHRNLWNTGRQFQVQTILASRSLKKGLTRTRGDIALTDRWLLGMRLEGAVAVFAQESREEYGGVEGGEYTLDRIGADLSVKKDVLSWAKLTVRYTHEFVEVRKPSWDVEDTEELRISLGQETTRSASVILERDTRRPFFDPGSGSLTRVAGVRAGGFFGGDNSYNKFTTGWAQYQPFYGRSVIAVSSRLGYADAFGSSKTKGVPEYERFYVGGSSTIRGYDEKEFGPGDFMLLANLEVRFPIVWNIVGVAFIDMGNVWPSIRDVKRSDFDLRVPPGEYTLRRASDVKYSVGGGIGYETPVGPARIDYGMRLKRGILESGKKESAGMIHITWGHAF